jgi:hypothetical protein
MWDMLQSSAAFTCLFARLALERLLFVALNCKFRAHFDLILFADAVDPDWGPRKMLILALLLPRKILVSTRVYGKLKLKVPFGISC